MILILEIFVPRLNAYLVDQVQNIKAMIEASGATSIVPSTFVAKRIVSGKEIKKTIPKSFYVSEVQSMS